MEALADDETLGDHVRCGARARSGCRRWQRTCPSRNSPSQLGARDTNKLLGTPPKEHQIWQWPVRSSQSGRILQAHLACLDHCRELSCYSIHDGRHDRVLSYRHLQVHHHCHERQDILVIPKLRFPQYCRKLSLVGWMEYKLKRTQ